ncbi:MAG: peptidyl-prolyl cis-trans isomerase [Ignavibacteria bacterium]|nr:MAG: peptidyl-prolyl cis-trans isomerase [Ignavibacteria bacterium]
MSFRRHLNNKIYLTLFCSMALLAACEEEKVDKTIVARVGDVVLTEHDLSVALEDGKKDRLLRNEFIRHWVEREVLYREAQENKITQSEKYLLQKAQAEKELAGAMLLDQMIEQNETQIDEDDAKEYFDEHRLEFKLTSTFYLLNKAEFKDNAVAENFRYVLFEKGWDDAAKAYSDAGNSKIESNIFMNENDLEPASLKRYFSELHDNEVSVIIQNNETYQVFQKLKEYPAGEIPEFEIVKNKVFKLLRAIEAKQKLNRLLKDLYSKYEVKIY